MGKKSRRPAAPPFRFCVILIHVNLTELNPTETRLKLLQSKPIANIAQHRNVQANGGKPNF